MHTEWNEELVLALAAPFPGEEEFLPRGKTAGKVPCLAYIGGESVISRLNQLVGPQGWSIETEVLVMEGQRMVMRGRLTILGQTHEDYGEANGEDELYKSCFTDTLKRCATQFGVGLYLRYLKATFGESDGKRLIQAPQLSDAARNDAVAKVLGKGQRTYYTPTPKPKPPAPATALTPAPPAAAAKSTAPPAEKLDESEREQAFRELKKALGKQWAELVGPQESNDVLAFWQWIGEALGREVTQWGALNLEDLQKIQGQLSQSEEKR